MQYNEKLDAALAALEGDMVETLQRWVRVPSVRAERSGGECAVWRGRSPCAGYRDGGFEAAGI